MSEIILSINAGSSSVKVSVYSSPTIHPLTQQDILFPKLLAEATIEGLTAPPAALKYERGSKRVKGQEVDNVKTQDDAFVRILDYLTQDEGLEELQNRGDIRFTCHRVVHGGDFPSAQVIDDETFHRIAELSDLAPL
jgi:acetate kinase